MARLSFNYLFALALVHNSLAAVPSGVQQGNYQLNIEPNSTRILACGSITFDYTITPSLSTFAPVTLVVSVESADGSLDEVLDNNAILGDLWTWSPIRVLPGQYTLSISSAPTSPYTISGLSDPFSVETGSGFCLGSSGSASSQSSVPTSSSTTPQRPTSNSASNTPKPSSPTVSHSSSSSNATPGPTIISTAAHSSVGIKAGVSVAVIAVALAGAGALYWLFLTRRRRPRNPQNNLRGYGPGYDGLESRDDYLADPKAPVDPLGRSLSGGLPPGGAVSSYSRSDFLDEKSAQASAIGGASSNGATAGHSAVDSFTALNYLPPTVPPPASHNNNVHPIVLVGRSASGSSTVHESGSSEGNDFETATATSSIGVQPPRRAVRKPVPAYGNTQVKRNSHERRNRNSDNSMNNPSYASSLNDLPVQPAHAPPNTLNHKGSFGETKPMNHVLMPDLPLTQN